MQRGQLTPGTQERGRLRRGLGAGTPQEVGVVLRQTEGGTRVFGARPRRDSGLVPDGAAAAGHETQRKDDTDERRTEPAKPRQPTTPEWARHRR
jgi:hypothetical protein